MSIISPISINQHTTVFTQVTQHCLKSKMIYLHMWIQGILMLDLCEAFDMINASILHDYLKDWFGLDGTVLTWLDSYLTNHKQKIKLENRFSSLLVVKNPRNSLIPKFLVAFL